MKLARVIRLDESDSLVFEIGAEAGEWAVSGAFAFSNWTEDQITGKAKQAFSNGWLGLESFGRSTFVAVARITEQEIETVVAVLAAHFVEHYGAPDLETASAVARQEVDHMREMCEDQDDNTLMIVERSLEAEGIREKFRVIPPQDAPLEAFAVHATLDDEPHEH